MAHDTMTDLLAEFDTELRADLDVALDEIAAMAPGKVAQNFDTSGKRGGNEQWLGVTLSWLRERKTWPDKGSYGSLTPAQMAYMQQYKPLIDTGALRGSVIVMERSTAGARDAYRLLGSQLPYAMKHEMGDGVKRRPWLHLVEDDMDDVDRAIKRVLE